MLTIWYTILSYVSDCSEIGTWCTQFQLEPLKITMVNDRSVKKKKRVGTGDVCAYLYNNSRNHRWQGLLCWKIVWIKWAQFNRIVNTRQHFQCLEYSENRPNSQTSPAITCALGAWWTALQWVGITSLKTGRALQRLRCLLYSARHFLWPSWVTKVSLKYLSWQITLIFLLVQGIFSSRFVFNQELQSC